MVGKKWKAFLLCAALLHIEVSLVSHNKAKSCIYHANKLSKIHRAILQCSCIGVACTKLHVCMYLCLYVCTSAHVYYLVVPLGGSCRSAPAGAVRCAGRGSLVQDSLGHLPTKFSCTLETFQSSSTLARKGSAALITTVSGNFCG